MKPKRNVCREKKLNRQRIESGRKWRRTSYEKFPSIFAKRFRLKLDSAAGAKIFSVGVDKNQKA